jgi:DNA gyrase subunit A
VVEELANKSSKCFIVVVTTKGMIKRMSLDDIITATAGGIIYSKLNQGDSVKDIIIAGAKNDVVVYTKSKALRMTMDQIPYLKRATVGNKAISSTDNVDGLAVITPETTDIVVITNKGYFNRFSISGMPAKARAKAPDKVIKLTKGDTINSIFSCNPIKHSIIVVNNDGATTVNIEDIPVGSSISSGTKLFKNGIIKCELLRK